MLQLSRTVNLLFHPFLCPIYGLLLFQWINPRSVHSIWPFTHYIPLLILTVVIPSTGWLLGDQLKGNKRFTQLKVEALLSRLFFIVGLILLLSGSFPLDISSEIYFFFTGLLIAVLTQFSIGLIGYSADLHLACAGGILAFLVCLSVFFSVTITDTLVCIIFLTGIVGSIRIYITKSGYSDILIGWIIGICAQLVVFKFWI